jgi:hypothetical protein
MSNTTTPGFDGETATETGPAEPVTLKGAGADTEHLTGPVAPEPLETLPVLVAVPAPRPWYRRPYAWVVATVALVVGASIALTLMLTVFAGPTGASAVLVRDGYTVADTMNAGQVAQYISSGAGGQDAKAVAGMVTDAAYGVKGSNAEIVVGLNPAGVDLFTVAVQEGAFKNAMGPGVTTHMDGSNLVFDGPDSVLNGPDSTTSTTAS